MNYLLISEYIVAIENNFGKLSCLRPVLGIDGQFLMTSGNYAVILKVKAEQREKFYVVKCFTKDQKGWGESLLHDSYYPTDLQ